MTSHTGCRKFDTFISATKRSLTPLRHPVIAVDLVLFARGIARRTAGRHNINAITSTHTHILAAVGRTMRFHCEKRRGVALGSS
jgi:hypothetical protein